MRVVCSCVVVQLRCAAANQATRAEIETFGVEELKEFLSIRMGDEIQEECLESLARNRESGG